MSMLGRSEFPDITEPILIAELARSAASLNGKTEPPKSVVSGGTYGETPLDPEHPGLDNPRAKEYLIREAARRQKPNVVEQIPKAVEPKQGGLGCFVQIVVELLTGKARWKGWPS